MSEEVQVDGVSYVSSRRAAEVTGYAQDYIGQLCRGGNVDARRMGGLWYVNLDSLYKYKQKADSYVPVVPRALPAEKDALITLEGRDYVSTARAAEITGYHKDYVGQLAREGVIASRQVGSRWYVERNSILAHKKEKDSLLGAVQAEAVGIQRSSAAPTPSPDRSLEAGPYMKYTADDRELLPVLETKGVPPSENLEVHEIQPESASLVEPSLRDPSPSNPIPIRIDHSATAFDSRYSPPAPGSSRFGGAGVLAASLATIVIFVAVGLLTLRDQATYAFNSLGAPMSALSSGASGALTKIGDLIEPWIVEELVYRRSDWIVREE